MPPELPVRLGPVRLAPGRLAPVGLVLVLLVAGCTAGTPAGDPSTDTVTETPATSSPPTAARTPESPTATPPTATPPPTRKTVSESPLTPKELPDRPDTLTRESVLQFASEYERAYRWNRELTNRTTELSIEPVRSSVLDATESGYVVHLEVGLSKTLRRDGSEMVGDGFYTANYFVNETTIVRAAAGGQRRPGPDPHNGTVLEG